MHSALKHLAFTMRANGDDNSYRYACPRCGHAGGSFSLTIKDGMILGHCFRAGCNYTGGTPANRGLDRYAGDQAGIVRLATPDDSQAFTWTEEDSSRWKLGTLYDDILDKQLPMIHKAARYDPDLRVLALPFQELGGDRIIAYRYYEVISGKLKTFKVVKNEGGKLAACPNYNLDIGHQGPVILVEDLISAWRLCHSGIPAIPLHGVGFSNEQAEELSNYTDSLLIILDSDATELSLKIRNRVDKLGLFSRVVSWPMRYRPDIKDMSPELFASTKRLLRKFK